MPTRPEMLSDGTLDREKALGVAGRFEASQMSLSLAGGLMGVLRAIVEISMLTMYHSREELAFGSSRAREFIGDNYSGDIG
jgi:hypothetical protein